MFKVGRWKSFANPTLKTFIQCYPIVTLDSATDAIVWSIKMICIDLIEVVSSANSKYLLAMPLIGHVLWRSLVGGE